MESIDLTTPTGQAPDTLHVIVKYFGVIEETYAPAKKWERWKAKYKILKNKPIAKLIRHFTKLISEENPNLRISMGTLKFLFEGNIASNFSTPNSLGLKHNNEIYVVLCSPSHTVNLSNYDDDFHQLEAFHWISGERLFSLLDLPHDLLSKIYSEWLDLADLARLDTAVCSRSERPRFMHAINGLPRTGLVSTN